MASYKLSFTAEEIDEKLGKIDNALLTTEQTLTEEQKAQARANIGIRHIDNFLSNIEQYGLPVLRLNGDASAMTKENAVNLNYEYGDKKGVASVKWQGSSSIYYPKKNYTIKFDNAFEAREGWGEQKKYCLKANYIDHSHARNIVSAKLWGQIVNSRTNPISNLRNMFDMTQCKGLYSHEGNLISGTQPVSGVISTTSALAKSGAVTLDGLTCAKGVYTIKADIFITSSNSTQKMCLGYYNPNESKLAYFTKMVNTNAWTNVEMLVPNPVENANVLILPESNVSGEKMDIKNINICRVHGESVFDYSSIDRFVTADGYDASTYFPINGFNIDANYTAFSNNVFITGKTYPKGKYKIYFSAVAQRSESQIPYTIRVGFGVGHNVVTKNVEVEQQYTAEFFEVEIENTIDNAYFTIQPTGSPESSVNLSALFRFGNIGIVNVSNVSDLPNGGAIDGFPIVITLNDEFHGLYTFNIPKDGYMLNMGDGTNEAILCADYSDASRFAGEATLEGDFEVEYVSDENDIEWVKTSVNRLINAVMNSNGTDLDTTIAQYLDWDSAIDYLIFKTLLNGVDMGGKNYLLCTYNGVKWFFTAYDMDTTFGIDWDGERYYKAKRGGFAIGSHNLDNLILRHKKDALKARYAELRNSIMSEDNVMYEYVNFIGQIPSNLYAEDAKKWTTIPNTSTSGLAQIINYYRLKVEDLDAIIEAL